MEIGNFFTLEYYFNPYPQSSWQSIFVAIYFVAILALRPYLRILASRHNAGKIIRKLQKKHIRRLALIGIAGIVSISGRHLMLPIIGMRIIAYLLILWSFYEIFEIISIHTKKNESDKYLPKRRA